MMLAEAPTIRPLSLDRLNGPDDFVPEWDVPSIASPVTDELLRAIEAVGGRDEPDPATKIHLLLGPPGYGKTHLLGRIGHRLKLEGNDALFLFIPAIEDLSRPPEHIRWWVVENLFREPEGGLSPLKRALCRLCRPSMLAYLDDLPASLAARYESLRERIDRDPNALREIIDEVGETRPFLSLAEKLQDRFPRVEGPIVRAWVLGWSPDAEKARRWLRGEPLPEEQAATFGLPAEPADPVAVIRAVSTMLGDNRPIALCLDQLDVLLKAPEASSRLSVDLMNLLASVPNLVIVLGCLRNVWDEFIKQKCNEAFLDRVVIHNLDERLNGEQAVGLVVRRLRSWPDRPDHGDELWPFDKANIVQFVDNERVFPRNFLQVCDQAFRKWLENGDQTVPIYINGNGPLPSFDILFREKWETELKNLKADRYAGLEHVQDQRFANVLYESLEFAKAHLQDELGVMIAGTVRKDPVPQATGGKLYRYTFEIPIAGPTGSRQLILALENAYNGQSFRHYFHAVENLIQEQQVVVCFVTTKEELPTGKGTQEKLDDAIQNRRMRVVSLQEHPDDYRRLDCFVRLLEKAEQKDLVLGGQTIDPDRYRRLVAETQVLQNVRLLEQILSGWMEPALERPKDAVAARSEASAGEQAPAPTAVQPTPQPKPAVSPTTTVAPEGRTPGSDDAREEPSDVSEWIWQTDEAILKALGDFSLKVQDGGPPERGATFARFSINPGSTPINKIRNRAEDLKIRLGLETMPIIDSQPFGISIDVPLPVAMRRVLKLDQVGTPPASAHPRDPIWPVGQDVAGKTHWLNFADSNDCHLLVAGTTGSGKSELLKVMIASLARRLGPKRVQFVLVDPKRVTFNLPPGANSPFLQGQVIHDPEEAIGAVEACARHVEERYDLLQQRRLNDWTTFEREAPDEADGRLVIVFDEFADFMADRTLKKQLETPLKAISAKARAAGVHLVLATQRPEASVVTPLIRSNLPSRICLKVASKADSKLILDEDAGASLLGKGDLLWRRGAGLLRLQSPLVEPQEFESILFP